MKTQKSPQLFDSLNNILIERDSQKLALFEIAKKSILELGELEHTSDWDPYLTILIRRTSDLELINTSIPKEEHPNIILNSINNKGYLESETGYPEIIFGDFNEEEQETALKHHEEITNIIIYIHNPYNEEEPLELLIPLHCIQIISLER